MPTMLELGKNLVAKGKELGDPELVSMGMEMLEKYTPSQTFEINYDPPQDFDIDKLSQTLLPKTLKMYICTNCSYTFEVDKPGRKKCPECKKHSLIIPSTVPVLMPKRDVMLEQQINKTAPQSGRATANDFSMQVRETKRGKIRYNDNGEKDGTFTKTQQVEDITNIWDDDKTEGFDKENERLKKTMKISPRTRKPVKLASVVCENCKEKYDIHPIHVGGRSRYVCDKCIKKKSKI